MPYNNTLEICVMVLNKIGKIFSFSKLMKLIIPLKLYSTNHLNVLMISYDDGERLL